MKNIIVEFSNKVKNDYHCFFKSVTFHIRFNSLGAATKAAEIYTRNQPKKPWIKEATVFSGSTITSPLNVTYTPYPLYSEHINKVIIPHTINSIL